jgi:hypothetical protein
MTALPGTPVRIYLRTPPIQLSNPAFFGNLDAFLTPIYLTLINCVCFTRTDLQEGSIVNFFRTYVLMTKLMIAVVSAN